MSDPSLPKLVVLLSRFPFPLEKGDKLRAYYQIRELAEKFNIHLLCINSNLPERKDIKELEKFCSKIEIFELPKWKSYLHCLIALTTKKPLQVAYFTDLAIHRKIEKIIKTIQPNHIYCQLIRTAEYVKDYHDCAKTIDYMDAMSMGIQRRIPLVNWSIRWLFRLEAKRTRLYERKIYDYFENHTIISEQDARVLGTTPAQKVTCIPNGVSSFFLEGKEFAKPIFDLVFVGNLHYPPNVEAVKFIVQEILPESVLRGFQFRFLAAGANPAQSLIQLEKNTRNFQLLPNPVDIREAYRLGRIFLAPMKIGTGLQNKLLESLALGIPSITTLLANNALRAKDKEHILIAETAKEFVDRIQELDEQQVYEGIANRGQKFILDNYGWKQVTKPLVNELIIQDFLSSKNQ